MPRKLQALRLPLPEDVAKALFAAARRLRQSPAELVIDAIAQFLQDTDDLRAVNAFRRKPQKSATLQQVRRRLGLTRR